MHNCSLNIPFSMGLESIHNKGIDVLKSLNETDKKTKTLVPHNSFVTFNQIYTFFKTTSKSVRFAIDYSSNPFYKKK